MHMKVKNMLGRSLASLSMEYLDSQRFIYIYVCVCVRVSACVCVGYMIHMIICIYIYMLWITYIYIYVCMYIMTYIYIYHIIQYYTWYIYIYMSYYIIYVYMYSGATWGPMKPHSCQENMRQAIQRPMGSRASEVRSHPKSRQIDKRKYAYGMHWSKQICKCFFFRNPILHV